MGPLSARLPTPTNRKRCQSCAGLARLAARASVPGGRARRVCRVDPVPGSGGVSLALKPAVVLERSTPMSGAVELVVHHPPAAAALRPGQFFQLAVAAPQTILRRPYSAAWADPDSGRIGFIFNVVGAGSGWLAVRPEGHELHLLGPPRRGFDLDGSKPASIVAGGLRVGGFPGAVGALVARGRQVTVLLGARTSAQLLPSGRFPGAEVMTATDDGTAGYQGSVVDL